MSAFVSLPKMAKEAADRGDLLTAIQLTRETMGVTQNEAQQAVNAYVRGAAPNPNASRFASQASTASVSTSVVGNTNWNGSGLPPQAIAALTRGNMIEAIKHTRDTSGLRLKEARDSVMTFLERNPHIKQQFQTALSKGGVNFAPVFAILVTVLIVAGAIAVYLLTATG